MKKKYGINIMLFVIILCLIAILSCAKSDKKSETGSLLRTDSEFSDMSVKSGMFRAFLFYVADSGVLLRDNAFPLVGRQAMQTLFEAGRDTAFVLSWKPLFEKLSENGDLGYTYGIYTRRGKNGGETAQGTYVTIWQKQDDGTWKFVLDTGTQGLPGKPSD